MNTLEILADIDEALDKWRKIEKGELPNNLGLEFCSLCSSFRARYLSRLKPEDCCGTCPLKSIGECCLEDGSAWKRWSKTGQANLVIEALQEAREWYIEKNKEGVTNETQY